MPGLFASWTFLFAEKAAPAAGAAAADASPFGGLIYYAVPLTFLFYLVVLRPQQQQDRKRRETLSALKKNDRVLTASGIYGTVMSVDAEADKVLLRIDDERGVKIAVTKGSIAKVLESQPVDKEKAVETA